MNKLPRRVYFVTSPTDETVLIGLDVQITGQNIRWLDTVKERRMTIEKIIDDNPDHFVFERAQIEDGGVYTFEPMTLKIYNERVKHLVLIPREFTDEETLLREFEKSRSNIW